MSMSLVQCGSDNNDAKFLVMKSGQYKIKFSGEEFLLYECLFKICDRAESSQLSFQNEVLRDLLERTGLSEDDKNKVFVLIADESVSNLERLKDTVSFHQWLLMCKLISLIQGKQLLPSLNEDNVLSSILESATTSISTPVSANFNFASLLWLKSAAVASTKWLSSAIIEGWQEHLDDDRHIKFRIKVVARMGTEDTSAHEVFRRFSDFEALVVALHKSYPGLLVPPLPHKDDMLSVYFRVAKDDPTYQIFLSQRLGGLQLFLDALVAHPLLIWSFEARTFLEASVQGFTSFREVYAQMNFDPDTSGEKSWVDGRISLSNGASTLVSSFFKIATKTVSSIAEQPWVQRVVSGMSNNNNNSADGTTDKRTCGNEIRNGESGPDAIPNSAEAEAGACDIERTPAYGNPNRQFTSGRSPKLSKSPWSIRSSHQRSFDPVDKIIESCTYLLRQVGTLVVKVEKYLEAEGSSCIRQSSVAYELAKLAELERSRLHRRRPLRRAVSSPTSDAWAELSNEMVKPHCDLLDTFKLAIDEDLKRSQASRVLQNERVLMRLSFCARYRRSLKVAQKQLAEARYRTVQAIVMRDTARAQLDAARGSKDHLAAAFVVAEEHAAAAVVKMSAKEEALVATLYTEVESLITLLQREILVNIKNLPVERVKFHIDSANLWERHRDHNCEAGLDVASIGDCSDLDIASLGEESGFLGAAFT